MTGIKGEKNNNGNDSKKVYSSQCETDYFKEYIDKTANMLIKMHLTDLAGDTLINQGDLFLIAKSVK